MTVGHVEAERTLDNLQSMNEAANQSQPSFHMQVTAVPGISELPAALVCAIQPSIAARQSFCHMYLPSFVHDAVTGEPLACLHMNACADTGCGRLQCAEGCCRESNGGAICTCRFHSSCGSSRMRLTQPRMRPARRRNRQNRWSSSKVGHLFFTLLFLVPGTLHECNTAFESSSVLP